MMMTKMKLTILTVATFLFTACGGGGGEDTSNRTGLSTPEPTAISMKIGQLYAMKEGQTIVRDSDPTVVVLETDIEAGVTIATLQSGSASIE